MNEKYNKFFRYIIDMNGQLDNFFAKKVFASNVDENYFHNYDPTNHSFSFSTYSVIFDFCKQYHNIYNYAPTDTVISMELSSSSSLSLAEKREVDSIITAIRHFDPVASEFDYVLGQIVDEYVRLKAMAIRAKATEISRTDPLGAVDYELNQLAEIKSRTAIYESMDERSLMFQDVMGWQFDKFEAGEDISNAYIPYGYRDWDMQLGGMENASLVVIAGPSNIGKSWVAHDIAYNAGLLQGKRVVIADREMTYNEVITRLLCRITGLTSRKLRSRENQTEAESNLIRATLDRLRQSEEHNMLFVPPNKCTNPTQLKREIEMFYGNEKPELIMVDYIEEMFPSAGNTRGWEAVDVITSELKQMGIYFGCPVLTITQNNRSGLTTEDPGVEQLSHASVLKKANTIIMLSEDRQSTYLPPAPGSLEPGTPGTILAKIIKNRGEAKNIMFRLEVEFATASIRPQIGFTPTAIGRAMRLGA